MKNAILFLAKWVIIFIVTSVLIFAAVRMMPSTPVDKWLDAYHLPHTEENIEYVESKMGLNEPLPLQYVNWIGNFIKGDWGVSLVSGENIRERFMAKMPYSFSIGITGILLGAFAAFFLGYRAALRRNGLCDRLTTSMTIFCQSIPMFILSILIINAFGVRLGIASFFTGDGRYSLLAAILLTALYSVGGLSRVVRSAFREEMSKSYVKFMVSRGFSPKMVLWKHAYKPPLASLVSAIITRFAGVFGGSTVLEFAFAIPGLSTMLVSAMDSRDYSILQPYILVVVIWMFFVHLILNPFLRMLGARRSKA
jgi:peptide/nickel transport system permease protein